MKLTQRDITENRAEWISKGYEMPEYDREKMIEKTKARPQWVHFGPGNIFRSFQAVGAQKLLNEGAAETGIIAVDGHSYEIVPKSYRPHDNLCVAVTLRTRGTVGKTVVGSIAETVILDPDNASEIRRMKEIFRAPSLQMVSFTITEKGYAVKDTAGHLLPETEKDLKTGPSAAYTYIGKLTALLYERYLAGQYPLALVSMDNMSHNGDKLREAVCLYADAWGKAGNAEPGFASYVKDSSKVSFPWSMIDKITPRPHPDVAKILEKDGLDLTPALTSKGTYIAPYVNAEESEYLVIEDSFPNGRPVLEKAGVIFTDKETVDKVEKMKVCTCLNPVHTALAVFGCLLGYTKISEEMKDADLVNLVERIGYKEGLPVVVDPGILDPKRFLDTVINVRVPNPFLPDTPQRIATDTSQKLAIRFGETVKAYMRRDDLDVRDLRCIPLVFAGWLRYLMAIDDEGNPFTPSSDPLLSEVTPYVRDFELGRKYAEEEIRNKVLPLLKNAAIFGTDLEECGLADRVIADFGRMLEGKGAVRRRLQEI